jgi:hypothetical protein
MPAAAGQVPPPRHAFLFDVPGVSFEELLGVPEILALARAGGAGLMRVQGAVEPFPPYPELVPGNAPITEWEMDPDAMGGLDVVGSTIRERVEGADVDEVLVVVMSRTGSAEMRAAKDELHPVVVAVGPPDELFAAQGEPGSLTSDTTRRAGVVTDLDVLPTLAPFFGAEPAADWEGSPIRIVDGSAPFELRERYLAQRRLYVPIGTAAAIYVTVVGLLGVAFVWLGRRVPETARRAVGWACLSAAAMGAGLLAAGHLPQLTYAAAVPFVAIVTVFGTMAFSPLERRSTVWYAVSGRRAGVLRRRACSAGARCSRRSSAARTWTAVGSMACRTSRSGSSSAHRCGSHNDSGRGSASRSSSSSRSRRACRTSAPTWGPA